MFHGRKVPVAVGRYVHTQALVAGAGSRYSTPTTTTATTTRYLTYSIFVSMWAAMV